MQQTTEGSQYYQMNGQVIKDCEKENQSPLPGKIQRKGDRKFIGDRPRAQAQPQKTKTAATVDVDQEKVEFFSIIKELKSKLQNA